MLELGRRERHLLSGLGVQVIMVALLVFAYTQAARQLHYQRDRCLELKEQLSNAKVRLEKAGRPDLTSLKARLLDWERSLAAPDSLGRWGRQIEALARDRFELKELQVQVSPSPEKTIGIPLSRGSSFDVDLYAVELNGKGATRNIAALLETLENAGPRLFFPLEEMELEGNPAAPEKGMALHLKWLVAAKRPGATPLWDGKTPASTEERSAMADLPASSLAWGRREEPFLSPVLHPEVIRIPAEVSARFKLTGILWDRANPTCIINGTLLGLGDSLERYRLVLLTRNAVLLEAADSPAQTREEIFLSNTP